VKGRWRKLHYWPTPKADPSERRPLKKIRVAKKNQIFLYVSCSGLKEPAETAQPVHGFFAEREKTSVWLTARSRVECWRFSNVSANTAVTMFRVCLWGVSEAIL
jgi:hypothetical protein